MEILERIWEFLSGFFSGILRRFEKSVTAIFGSSNERMIKRLHARVDAINALEPRYQAMSDADLKDQTALFRERLSAGETLDDILEEAFAVCREAGRRYLNMRHYDVQLIGGMILHSGAIAEMVTGEGKTLVATLPAYLNALAGSVHVITVNDYLARRDMEWMGPLHMSLGLTVGAIQSGMEPSARQQAYQCDITYGTNNEFGFDYLRDNMRTAAREDDRFSKYQQQCQGPLNFAIIDEVDNILIDEARTPLIISGQAHSDIRRYSEADRIARQLKKETHFTVSEKEHSAHLTDAGVREAEKLAGVESFYTAGNMEWPHLIDNALKAHYLYKRDVNYVVKEGAVIIVDEFTGRLMEGRQWSDGLHQAVEAKEGVRIKEETQTLATITLQNFFKLYNKLSGMTGTAMTEAGEFWKIYELDVVAIPTNRKLQRIEQPDTIYRTEQEKYAAMADEIEQLHRWDTLVLRSGAILVGEIVKETEEQIDFKKQGSKATESVSKESIRSIQKRGRPILVGTVSIEKSEHLGSLLSQRGVKHEVLNAKQHKREADIVAQAGRLGAVTIATNMAGRGTDIVLGGNPETMAWAQLQHKYETRLDVPAHEWEELVDSIRREEDMESQGEYIRNLGGLHIIGTERHEARRIDLQLRGRSGRQGDPGSSRFYLSLEDDLMRIFAGEWVRTWLTRLGMQEGEAIESKMVSRRIEGAQKKVEERNFEIRKNLLEYDEVMDEQRKRVYDYRQNILDGANCKTLILEMLVAEIDKHLSEFLARDFGTESFAAWASGRLGLELDHRDFRDMDFKSAEVYAKDEADRASESQVLDAIEENLPEQEDPGEWNWAALAKFANARWQLSLRDRDLKKIGRDQVDTFLLEKARAAVDKIDLGEGASYLDKDYGLKTAINWVQYKFGISLPQEEFSGLEPHDFQQRILSLATEIYSQKEIEFPVMGGLLHYTTRDASGNRRYDREQLIDWARDRFGVDLDLEDLKSKQRDEIREVLLSQSREHYEAGQNLSSEIESLVDGALGEKEMGIGKLMSWAKMNLNVNWETEKIANWDAQRLQLEMESAWQDRFCPEIRRMERSLTLQILDSAWKDHLLAMDHLRSSVGLRGYAQVDPKVEYKREGMRTFDAMWESIQERVTDLVFRMEQLDDDFVSATWVETAATHDEAKSAASLADEEQGGEGNEIGEGEKIEPIRNRKERIGRNAPCPCGSGKKYKNCCMRSGSGAQQPIGSR
ncbi:MAG: SEC-C metal-binding domain-containing protein [Planctomycetota bacterium]|nr:SEC-C metal-binding domain-containing protein [Planctomycetota bacterium]